MTTQNLSTLKIHKLTKAQYERELAAGNIDANAIYLTPDEGGNSGGIIDAIELPTENIDENSLYRTLTGEFYGNGLPIEGGIVHVVKKLPSVGVPIFSPDGFTVFYYEADTNSVMGYIDEAIAEDMGLDLGWYSAEVLMSLLEVPWGGVIWSKEDDPIDEVMRVLLSYSLYQFKNKWININENDHPGWKSPTARGAEIFNLSDNIASGECSHAEGEVTHAEGQGSHAEGYGTHAKGNQSHAEGGYTHAEGKMSHAEGGYTHAEGEMSHAEGLYSHAVGLSQHVQGAYNVIDPEYNAQTPYSRAKYAHIVGNGTSDTKRSNAHTLDWSGNAWFAGTVYVGGTSQSDASEVALKTDFETIELITVADIDAICAATIQVASANDGSVTF